MDKMKALILSISAGAGHVQAAEAIKKYIMLNNPNSEVKILDTLKYINPIIDKVVIGSYLTTIKTTPSLFGKLYEYAETDDGLATVSNKVNELLAFRIAPLINEFKPEILICTHPFPAEMVSVLKMKGKINIPVISILTDYAPHSFWIQPAIDAYIVSNSDMIDEMISRGVDKDIIYDLGIPVNPSFIKHHDRSTTLNELGLSPNKPTLLIMGGSLGIGKISDIYNEVLKLPMDVQILVITGSNKKLFDELTKIKDSSLKDTRIIGFTGNVNKYMQACDLLLTKPGGLTITEALICGIPIAIFSPIPGQEEKNAEFLLKHGLAIHLGDGKNCSNIIEELLSTPDKLNNIKINCAKFSKPCAGDDIYKLLEHIIQNTA
jgi:processive 1,2-diacylglycerol beta-glucosyltransferase